VPSRGCVRHDDAVRIGLTGFGSCTQAFTRTAQLEPDNGEAWNNIAAIHMRAGR